MKKTLIVAAGLLVVTTVVVVNGRLGAQGTIAPAASARGTRIATMNLAYVIKNYQKFKAFENEMKGSLKQFDERLAGKRAMMEALGKEAANPATTPAQKDELEKKGRDIQRSVEDINNDAKAFIGKKRDDQIVQLYKEVQDAAQRYALSQGIDLVLHYTDATTQEDYYNPVNVARKLQSPGCMPLYAAQGTDISQEVVIALNRAYTGGNGSTALPATGTGATAATTTPTGN